MSPNSIREGEKAAKRGMLNLIILGVIKLAAGLVTGMTVVLADAISTFADTLGIFASYIGLRLSRKNADERFEYGYYKIETFAALLISLGIIYLGYTILIQSIDNFFVVKAGEYRLFALSATLIAIIFSYRLEKSLRMAGEKSNSLSLLASAQDKKMDMYAGIAILISIIANYNEIPYVEGIVSILISLIIIKVGVYSSKESLFFLLDYWDNPGIRRDIMKILKHEKDFIISVKNLRLRRAGTFIFGQAFIEINPFSDLQDLREELEILQNKIKNLNPYIKDFVIYSHIPEIEKEVIAVPIKSGNDLNAVVANSLEETKAYLFAQIKNEKIKKFYIKKLSPAQKKPLQLSNFIKKEKVNILIDNQLNSLIFYNLRRTHHIVIYPNLSDIKTAGESIELILIDI
ncbi:cation transporter [Candidatus Peregrinibacteria bacterium]|nr:cation transporter [Candidatus Peregrinibacteria bacterium]